MVFTCPYCGSHLKNRSTQFQTPYLAIEYHRCTKALCGASFRIEAEMVRVTQEPIELDEPKEIGLPRYRETTAVTKKAESV